MTASTPPRFADPAARAVPLYALCPQGLEKWLEARSDRVRQWVSQQGFKAAIGQFCVIPSERGETCCVLAGLGDDTTRARGRFALAAAVPKLPGGAYALHMDATGAQLEEQLLGWLLSQYSFEKYRANPPHTARLSCPDGVEAPRLLTIAQGEFLTRDLINTPANDMGPEALEAATRDLADQHGATLSVIKGDALLAENFPMIHAVGRSAAQSPRLLEMTWGESGPSVALVGKGVCFDTGGLNIKPGASMGLMKKDMGGAATVLGLAHMIMGLDLNIRLRVLIPAVENAISGDAFRPQDILTSRAGLSVEVNNTDAEGRLVLADALTYADETTPDLLVSMATLTGAARVAVGSDLVPFYTDDTRLAAQISASGDACCDPVWRMPLYRPYEPMIEPGIADLDNAPKGGFAGSITAALFLDRFVSHTPSFVHFDLYGWQPSPEPGRPKGGVGQAARALLDALPKVLDLS